MGRAARVGTASEVFDDFIRPSRYKALYGGRGSGKSHFFAEAMVANAYQNKGFRGACIREVQKDLKESAKLLIEDKIRQFGMESSFRILQSEIVTPGDGLIIFKGMHDYTAESVASLEGFNVAWIEEAQAISARSWELLRPTIRAPGSEIWAGWNPRSADDPVDQFFRGVSPPANAIIARINYDENRFFPDELEAERQHDLATNKDRYAHIWLGDYEPMAIGAIWDRQTIHANRVHEMPDVERVVIAVDPAVSAESGSDEHGIIVCGQNGNDAYVLEDGSTRGTPRQWATRVVALFDKYEADAIVIEVNQGGDMVKETINGVRPGLPVIEVRASKGKHVRAEPISAMYALGRVHHAGTFDKLEGQMCQMTAAGYEGNGSPDRVDALVWGMTELMPRINRQKPKRVHVEPIGSWMG